VESGTGSGSLTLSLGRTVAPTGHVYTFEYHEQRAKIAQELFERAGQYCVSVVNRDVIQDGFLRPGNEAEGPFAHAAMIDLPAPWAVVEKLSQVLLPAGRFCGFSPCVEQVQRTCDALREAGFVDVCMKECLTRPYFPVRNEPPLFNSKNQTRKRKKYELQQDDESDKTTSASQQRMSVLKPVGDIRGHTGYLCFASKKIQ